jgi:hypothetical protein
VPYRMEINQPNLADGAELWIHGLGMFKNGETYDITDEQAEKYRLDNARDSGEIESDSESPHFGVQHLARELGPSLLDVDIHGITVTEVTANAPSSRPVVSSSGGAPSDNDDEGGAS